MEIPRRCQQRQARQFRLAALSQRQGQIAAHAIADHDRRIGFPLQQRIEHWLEPLQQVAGQIEFELLISWPIPIDQIGMEAVSGQPTQQAAATDQIENMVAID